MSYNPGPLPTAARRLCEKLQAPPRLVAHLALVHEAAAAILTGLTGCWPLLNLDTEAVLFGAATHDLGKVLYPNELTSPGHRHEGVGPQLLEENGVAPELARFSSTHAAWSRKQLPLEDLIVALADTVWKGQRSEDLDRQVVDRISDRSETERWEVFAKLDDVLNDITVLGEERLAWQQTQSV